MTYVTPNLNYLWLQKNINIFTTTLDGEKILTTDIIESISKHSLSLSKQSACVYVYGVDNYVYYMNGCTVMLTSLKGKIDIYDHILSTLVILPYMLSVINPLKLPKNRDKRYTLTDKINKDNINKYVHLHKQTDDNLLSVIENLKDIKIESTLPTQADRYIDHLENIRKILKQLRYSNGGIPSNQSSLNMTRYINFIKLIETILFSDNTNIISDEDTKLIVKSCLLKYKNPQIIPKIIDDMKMFLEIEIQLIRELSIKYISNKLYFNISSSTLNDIEHTSNYIISSVYNFDIFRQIRNKIQEINGVLVPGEMFYIKTREDFGKLVKHNVGKPVDILNPDILNPDMQISTKSNTKPNKIKKNTNNQNKSIKSSYTKILKASVKKIKK
jgi:hypothetical protein